MGLAWLALIVLASHASIFAVYAVYDLMPTVMYTRMSVLDENNFFKFCFYDKTFKIKQIMKFS